MATRRIQHIGAIAALVATVLLAGFWAMRAIGAGSSVEDEATQHCQSEVRDRIQSPSSAKFGDVTVDGSGDDYSVTGELEMSNAMGGTIRARYDCSLRRAGDAWVTNSAVVQSRSNIG